MEKRDSFDKVLDLLIEEAAEIVNENDGRAIGEAETREFSKEHKLKMKKLFNKLHREETSLRIVKLSKRAACVCLVAIIIAGASICSIDAWRKNVINFFYDKDAPNSKYTSTDTMKITFQESDIILSYLPYGFEVKKSSISKHGVNKWFEKEDLYYLISIYTREGKGSVDTGDAIISRVDIDDSEAILIEKTDLCQILWQDGEYEYYIAGNITTEEILSIAKNLKKF